MDRQIIKIGAFVIFAVLVSINVWYGIAFVVASAYVLDMMKGKEK